MERIAAEQITRRIERENPWWDDARVPEPYCSWGPRSYLEPFYELLVKKDLRRAIVLMGPRRVGKTVMVHHAIGRLIADGVEPRSIGYMAIDHPLYTDLGLEDLLGHYLEATGKDPARELVYLFFDEIQYLKDWERHLKTLVDAWPKLRVAVTGSAAAALRLKSRESGAGRFTDFLLPPLTFTEYLDLTGTTVDLATSAAVLDSEFRDGSAHELSLEKENSAFFDYINYGGYPEVVLNADIRQDPQRFIKGDIIDKVLLRDLPSLYGIQDPQELNRLFTRIAYNTGQEFSVATLSSESGIAKDTIRRYLDYLEAAFLIRIVDRIDQNAKRFKRRNAFKIYLTNPSLYCALFEPIAADDSRAGHLVETAVFAQTFHFPWRYYYGRWQSGEVDMVMLDSATQKPARAEEIKWSNSICRDARKIKGLVGFCRKNSLTECVVTTRSSIRLKQVDGVHVSFVPACLFASFLGNLAIALQRESYLSPLSIFRAVEIAGSAGDDGA